MSKIVRFHKTGDASVLQLDELEPQQPKAEEVRIKVDAIGLNRAEVMFRRGQYLEPPELPSKIGYEAAGVIEAVGPGVTDLKVGDKVSTIPSFSMNQYGVYGETAVVPAYAAVKYPDNLSSKEAAAIWMQYLTAYGALVAYSAVNEKDRVLITAASSSVGLAAIQICKSVNAQVIASTRKSDKSGFLREAGADAVIVTDEEDLPTRIHELTEGKGTTITFDPVAGPFLEKLAEAAGQEGVIYEYGALSSQPTPFPLFPALRKGLTIRGYTLFEIVQNPKKRAEGQKFVYEGLKKGLFKPIIDSTFPLHDIQKAHRHMESNTQKGKIVVSI